MVNGDILEAVKLRYFIVISLILHIFLLFFFRLNLEHKSDAFRPTYVQLVELPPPVPFIEKRIEIPRRPKAQGNETKMPKDSRPRDSRIDKPAVSNPEEISGRSSNKPIEETGKAVTGEAKMPESQKPQGPISTKGRDHPPGGIRGLPLITDKDIERFAKVEEPSLKKKEKSITLDTDEFKYLSYLERLKYRIEYIWRYPEKARIEHLQGDLYIRFSILKNGRLGDFHILRSSGYNVLDEAALQALKDSDPFWPLPDSWDLDEFTITGHFMYYLGGLYLK